jgi:hypothetical protein
MAKEKFLRQISGLRCAPAPAQRKSRREQLSGFVVEGQSASANFENLPFELS